MRTTLAADYLADPALRREIHGGLQVVEQWNSGNGIVFYGKNSDLTGADREDTETSMLALQFLQSALVHINTLLLQAVLEDTTFHDLMGPNEQRALTPLFWSNINPCRHRRLREQGADTAGATHDFIASKATSARPKDLPVVAELRRLAAQRSAPTPAPPRRPTLANSLDRPRGTLDRQPERGHGR